MAKKMMLHNLVKRVKIQKLQHGFTLIELMVSMFIMLTLLGIVLVNFTGLSAKRNLNDARNNLISDIRSMQSNALSAKDISPGRISGDYGVNLTTAVAPSNYLLFAEDTSAVPVQYPLSSVSLPRNIYIKSISITRPDASTTTASNFKVYYTVPYGRVLQTYSGGTITQTKEANDVATVTVSTSDNSQAFTFVINGISGSVSP